MEHRKLIPRAQSKLSKIIPLYLPWILASVLRYDPILSYFIAWTGTCFIFFHSVNHTGRLIQDEQSTMPVMRPIVLIQLVFAGLMSGSTIFFFLDHLGYYFWTNTLDNKFTSSAETYQLAYCQRIYSLAHAALTSGMILAISDNRHPRPLIIEHNYRWANGYLHLLTAALGVVLIAIFCLFQLPAFHQFAILLSPVPKCLSAVLLLKGLRYRRHHWTLIALTYFCYTFYQAAHSGYKESLFVQVIILVGILLPFYRKTVLSIALPTLLALLYLLPTWNITMRTELWEQSAPAEKAAAQAYSQIMEDDNQELVKHNSWDFLVNRFSEIGMFRQYINHVPQVRTYYGVEILENALLALIPRALWDGKPNTEARSMERVYEAEVLSVNSDASAKTRTVVDGYLSAGYPGVFITLICYGLICQLLCNTAERLFAGYEIGCIVVFNGMFQQLWRGNNFEFILNNVVYGFLLMYITHFLLQRTGLLVRDFNADHDPLQIQPLQPE